MLNKSPAVEFIDVWFKYLSNRDYILKGLSITISRGTSVAIMGANGSGKTTLLKHIVRLLKPQRGVVKVLGIDVQAYGLEELVKHVGFVPQNPNYMFFAPSIRDELVITLKNFKYPSRCIKDRVELIAESIGIGNLLNEDPSTLSYGQLKLASIAIALSHDPEVVVIDEPTMGLDKHYREALTKIIRQLVEDGRTVIASSHDVEFVSKAFNEAALLNEGRITAYGSLREVLYEYAELTRACLTIPTVPKLFNELRKCFNALNKPISVEEFLSIVMESLGGGRECCRASS
ncbi:MAG: ABC transporter ATP-binding protein [Desulfurococcaceae archaeon]